MDLRPDFHVLSLEDRVKAVMAEWQSDLPRLLIFDDCEDEDLLDQWLPTAGGSRVLVTSRRGSWDPSLGVIEQSLNVLGREESIELLRNHRPDLPAGSPDLNAIAEELGDVPLALDLAGRYLAQYRHEVTPAAYLAAIQRPELPEHPSLRKARGISPTKHDMDVWRTFAVSYRRLDPNSGPDGLAVRLLARAARLAAGEPLPGDLLAWTLESPEGDGDPPRPTTEFRDALDRLTGSGLLEDLDGEAFRMRRLVAAFALTETPDDGAGTAVEAACTRAAMRAQREGRPDRLEALLPHVRSVTVAAEDRGDAMAANCCTALGITLRELGAYAEALPYADRAWKISVDLYGKNGEATLQRRSNVASVLEHKSAKEAARTIYEEVLDAQERFLGPDHPDVAATCNNLGAMYRDEDLYHEVLPLYEKALRIRKGAWENTPPGDNRSRREGAYRLAESYSNRGALLMDLGRYRRARPDLESAVRILGTEVEEYHARNAGTLVILGRALRAEKEYPRTMSILGAVLDIYKYITGKATPPRAADALSNKGAMFEEWAEEGGPPGASGRAQALEGASVYLHAALNGSEEMYGEDHPMTGGSSGCWPGFATREGTTERVAATENGQRTTARKHSGPQTRTPLAR